MRPTISLDGHMENSLRSLRLRTHDPGCPSVPGMPPVRNDNFGTMGVSSCACITVAGHTCRWRRTPRNRERWSRPTKGTSLRSRWSVSSTTATADRRPDSTRHLALSRRWRNAPKSRRDCPSRQVRQLNRRFPSGYRVDLSLRSPREAAGADG